MGDMLVRLYSLPGLQPAMDRAEASGIRIKRPLPMEKSLLCRWVKSHFSEGWADEIEFALSNRPVTCFVAMDESSTLVGFAAYDTTYRGFFGPTGVHESQRGKGIGTALLLRSLHAMAESGYAYAIIGYSGADAYYAKTVGAIPIEGSHPGPYRNLLRRD